MEYNTDTTFSLFRNQSKGTGTDYHTEGNEIELGNFLNISRYPSYLERLYQNWACERIIDYFPEKMGEGWGQLIIDDNPKLVDETKLYFDQLRHIYIAGQKTGNLYGDAYVARIVDDGKDLSEPIELDKVSTIEYSRVFDYREVQPKTEEFYGDYYNPEHYHFYPSKEFEEINNFNLIHSSRLIRFSGKYLPPYMFEQNNYQYASVLKSFLSPLKKLEVPLEHIAEALTSFEFLLFALEGLFDTIANGTPDDVAKIKNRYKVIQKDLSSMRGAVRDKDLEDAQLVSREFKNIAPLIEEIRKEMIAASGLSKVQLYNEHPTGMNSTGESYLRVEAKQIMTLQKDKWNNSIMDDVQLVMSAHKIADGYNWEWLSTYQETQTEIEQRRLVIAQRDKIYFDMGVLSAEEIRQRFTGIEYTENLIITNDLPPTPDEPIMEDKEKKPIEKQDKADQQRKEPLEVEGNVLFESEFEPIELEDLEQITDE